MSSFLAHLSRMKYVNRWGLMRNTVMENDMEHSYMVSIIAHMLAVITNERYKGNVNIEKIILMAVYHEASEVMTGDLPTPVKYFDEEIYQAYSKIESRANDKLISVLPEDLQSHFSSLLKPDKDTDEWSIVKDADRIAAYIKCMEELKVGNTEFTTAKNNLAERIKSSKFPAVDDFMKEFVPSFGLTLEELYI